MRNGTIKLKSLLKTLPDIEVKGSKEIEILGITASSQAVAPGFLFIAKKGLHHNGAQFIKEAISAGAVCILTDLFDPFLENITQLIHPDLSLIESLLAKAFYEDADQELFLTGITGTNGKTTTSYLIRHLLQGLHAPCGLIGTIEWIVGEHVFPSTHTTPDLLTNYKLFHEMQALGNKACVMEVSSHGLLQHRVRGIDFDVALFTNLTQDHLDYHQTLEAYAEAKSLLFSGLKPSAVAVINADSPWKEVMVKECKAKIFTYGIDASCDLQAQKIRLASDGMDFEVVYQGKSTPVHSHLIGRFNVYNLLAAISVGLHYGAELKHILSVLKSFTKVPGRLERVPNPLGLNVFVDYAHTDDALFNVLGALREITKGRIITVFGCGGGRDTLKRPKMGKVAETLSDVVIVTSDNPRHEDPQEIIRQIMEGFQKPERAHIIFDRAQAIETAIELAKPEDAVLIAGKGHETYQIFPHQTIHFDDREEVLRCVSVDANL